ncbi:peroxidase-related enzyme [Pseudonocardia nematodicida]|uniref:Peroxidase-related enzyme n=1 Tax=Pseudonocardia nematodicida TaxID=1206997 RepID=A0ABV1KDY5_9PSEU
MHISSPISRFGAVEISDLPEDLRQRLAGPVEKSGFTPNIFRALGRRPDELRAFLDYHDALMNSDEGLSRAERELVVVATSGRNDCVYCVVAHGAILRVRSGDPQLAEHVATNPHSCGLDPRWRAIVDLALLVAQTPAAVTDQALDDARDAGLTDDEIWDIGAITAFFAASNRLAHLFALQPNEEFFTLGR